MALSIGAVGTTILISSLTGGQVALLQGLRRIKTLASIGIAASALSTLFAAVLYYYLKERGIVAVMIASAVGLVIRSAISHDLGVEAVGIYSAAWSLSGMLASFVLQAMGADFYPRLTAVAADNIKVNRMVNEQIEIACLLAMPGLLFTLAISPWIVKILYSASFQPAYELIPFLVGGVFLKVVGYPLGFIQRAKGQAKWIYFSQTEANLLLLVLSLIFLENFQLIGVSIASLTMYAIHTAITLMIAKRLYGFGIERGSASTIGLSTIGIVVGIVLLITCPSPITSRIVAAIGLFFSLYAVSTILKNLPPDHRQHRVFPLSLFNNSKSC